METSYGKHVDISFVFLNFVAIFLLVKIYVKNEKKCLCIVLMNIPGVVAKNLNEFGSFVFNVTNLKFQNVSQSMSRGHLV
jgi:hypothetical protein